MKYLGYGIAELEGLGGIHTAREIVQQPALWQKIYEEVGDRKKDIVSFFEATKSARRIILTGAGTSAFIGLSLRGVFQRRRGVTTEAISTTDLVTHPKDYLQEEIPTLLVSFARSGNSPESAAVLRIADQVCKTCFHLIITCNGEGLLAKQSTAHTKLVFTLPAEANDQSLAMTSSYSGMLLAGKLIADIQRYDQFERDVKRISTYAEKVINYYAEDIRQLAAINFTRAVFLGAGPFFGTATESHLKVQELTDGKVVCKSDSYLGFRHGPKAVVDAHTLVVYIFSNSPYAFQYERDLLQAMKKGNQPLAEVAIAESTPDSEKLDYNFIFSDDGQKTSEDFLAVCSVVPSQILAFYKSLQLGLKPDAPSVTGAISRVVEGVQIYSLQNEALL